MSAPPSSQGHCGRLLLLGRRDHDRFGVGCHVTGGRRSRLPSVTASLATGGAFCPPPPHLSSVTGNSAGGRVQRTGCARPPPLTSHLAFVTGTAAGGLVQGTSCVPPLPSTQLRRSLARPAWRGWRSVSFYGSLSAETATLSVPFAPAHVATFPWIFHGRILAGAACWHYAEAGGLCSRRAVVENTVPLHVAAVTRAGLS